MEALNFLLKVIITDAASCSLIGHSQLFSVETDQFTAVVSTYISLSIVRSYKFYRYVTAC